MPGRLDTGLTDFSDSLSLSYSDPHLFGQMWRAKSNLPPICNHFPEPRESLIKAQIHFEEGAIGATPRWKHKYWPGLIELASLWEVFGALKYCMFILGESIFTFCLCFRDFCPCLSPPADFNVSSENSLSLFSVPLVFCPRAPFNSDVSSASQSGLSRGKINFFDSE